MGVGGNRVARTPSTEGPAYAPRHHIGHHSRNDLGAATCNVSSGNIYYYEEDMLGSSRTMVQAGQTSVCFDADFLPLGYEKDVVNTCTQNYKFEGKERDTETANDDFGARYYTFRLGRWLSADWSSVPAPVPYANLTNPQTLNLYAMVSDNPESFADLDGHDSQCTGGMAGTNACIPTAEPNRPGSKPGEGQPLPQSTGTGTPPSPTQQVQQPTQQNTTSDQTGQQQNTNQNQPDIPQQVKDVHAAFDKTVSDMTSKGERIGKAKGGLLGTVEGMANNVVSSVQRLGELVHITHHHKLGCIEQAERVSNILNETSKSSYVFGVKHSLTHSWVEGRSSVAHAPVLVLDPWRNSFRERQ